jgi:uncharacterized membrane protein
MSYGIAFGARTQVPLIALLLASAVWLLFLPNAPYLLTDVVHVHNFHNATPGLIAGGLGVLAATGCVLFFISVATMRGAATLRVGHRAARWVVPLCAWTSSAGMYVGRVLRWNSWDVVNRPIALLEHAATHFADPATAAVAIALTASCALLLQGVYVVLSGWASPDRTTHAPRRSW